nr:cobalamin-dependent protein [Candidatus Njordarchaeum guaymaensis]
MSSEEAILKRIRSAVESLDFQKMREAMSEARVAGVSGYRIVSKAILEGTKRSGEIGLMVASEALRTELAGIADAERKKRDNSNREFSGRIIIGTVRGDIHDFGKNILTALLKSTGMDVEDLGVDVPASDFLKWAKMPEVKVIALSSLLSTGVEGIRKTIHALEEADLRKKVKVIIGGAAVSNEVAGEVKADKYAEDAVKGFEIIKRWVSNPRKQQ